METLYIWISICITIILITFMFLIFGNKSNKTVVKKIRIKDKDLKFDVVNILIYSDGTIDLEYYDTNNDIY